MGAFTMDSRKLLLLVMILGLSQISRAQSPTYGVGRTPTAEEIRKLDISIGPDGKELPPGRGTAVEGAGLFVRKACFGCHGETGSGGPAPTLIKSDGKTKSPYPCLTPCVNDSNVDAAALAVRDDDVGLHQPRHATHQRGHTKAQ